MKKFRVEHRADLNPDALDLVNVENPNDRCMCAEDEFVVGEIINEDCFVLREHSYVDDQSAGTALFAFRKTPITIYDLAIFKGAKEVDGSINGAEFMRLDLPIMGGCVRCEASIAAYNSYPSKSGYLKCKSCIGNDGFATVEEADAVLFPEQKVKIILEDDYSNCQCANCTGHNYSIYRYYRDERKKPQLIKEGLTLAEAKEHCQDPDTKGDGWFDGFTKEEIDYCGDEETIQKILGHDDHE